MAPQRITRFPEPPFLRYPDLASERLGARALVASDEFFAPKESLLRPWNPVFDHDRYTENGKWMDGWETRRRRTPGHDWCVVRLGTPGIIRGINVDTRHFSGNHPERASIDACAILDSADEARAADPFHAEALPWRQIVGEILLAPDGDNFFTVREPFPATHVRLNIYPDGGVARFRVHGEAALDWPRLAADGHPIDLGAAASGGSVVACSDEFFSAPGNLLLPGRAAGMHDGWETRRRRVPGHDWVVIRLGHRGRIVRAEVDTHWFKGNHPESTGLEVADVADAILADDAGWREILPRTRLDPDAAHVFAPPDLEAMAATHVRFSIYPDGGVARLRLYGEILM
ncbi:allantoicase [soil metagenome]